MRYVFSNFIVMEDDAESVYYTASEVSDESLDDDETEVPSYRFAFFETYSRDGTKWIMPLINIQNTTFSGDLQNICIEENMSHAEWNVKLLKQTMSTEKTVVKFTAEWCDPCKRISEDLKKECEKCNVRLIEIDIDKYEDISNKFRIRSVPTCYICNPGSEHVIVTGADMQSLRQHIRSISSDSGEAISGEIPVMQS